MLSFNSRRGRVIYFIASLVFLMLIHFFSHHTHSEIVHHLQNVAQNLGQRPYLCTTLVGVLVICLSLFRYWHGKIDFLAMLSALIAGLALPCIALYSYIQHEHANHQQHHVQHQNRSVRTWQ